MGGLHIGDKSAKVAGGKNPAGAASLDNLSRRYREVLRLRALISTVEAGGKFPQRQTRARTARSKTRK
jgi:hypothetical protein